MKKISNKTAIKFATGKKAFLLPDKKEVSIQCVVKQLGLDWVKSFLCNDGSVYVQTARDGYELR